MTDATELQRGYRRWLRWYPRAFRREHEAEILGVLMAGAREGQRRPELMECLDLMRSGLIIQLRPRAPRSNRSLHNAVKLMYVGALVEFAAAVVILVTLADVRANSFRIIPGLTETEWHAALVGQIAPNEVGAILAVGFWLWMAWSIGRGQRWARIAFALFFVVNVYGLLNGLATRSALYAQPDLTIGIVLCLVELMSVAVLFRANIAPSRPDATRISLRS